MKILLMGPPASGKGTVGEMLGDKLDLPIFSIGEMLRSVPESDEDYGVINEYMDKGDLVPPEIVSKLIKKEVSKEKYKNGYILDGWMRDMEQKDYFDPGLDFVIFINISEDTVMKRISGRRFCPNDGFSCNIYTLPPKDPNHCDECNGDLVQRDDDKPEVVKERLELYREDTVPVIEYYKNKGNLIEVDGEPKPEVVLGEVLVKLKEVYDTN